MEGEQLKLGDDVGGLEVLGYVVLALQGERLLVVKLDQEHGLGVKADHGGGLVVQPTVVQTTWMNIKSMS